MKKKPQDRTAEELFDSVLWFEWIMATTMGWLIGSLLFAGLAFLISGYVVALSQFFVLNQHIHKAWRWIIASGLGWTAGWFVSYLLVPKELDVLSSLVLGLALGVAQWWILRKEFAWAGWWIPLSILGWTAGISLLPGIFSTGALAGAVPGAALALLVRHPKLGAMLEQSGQSA